MTAHLYNCEMARSWLAPLPRTDRSRYVPRLRRLPGMLALRACRDWSLAAAPTDDDFDWRLAVAPDGQTALVSHSAGFFPQTRESSIYEVTLQPDGSWGDEAEVSFVHEKSSDIDPFYSADGSRVWFSSIRPIEDPRRDVDVWRVDRLADGSWASLSTPRV